VQEQQKSFEQRKKKKEKKLEMELIFQELFLSRYFFWLLYTFFVFMENISILFEW
jgi:hypothetical protein